MPSLALSLMLAGAVSAVAVSDPTPKLGYELVEGEWIVVLDKFLKPEMRAQHMDKMQFSFNATLKKQFSINKGEFQAYHVAGLNAVDVATLTELPEVRYVEQNHISFVPTDMSESVSSETESVGSWNDAVWGDGDDNSCLRDTQRTTWGISRTCSKDVSRTNPYEMDSAATGEGTTLYIIDTGVRITHNEFTPNRARHGPDFTGEGPQDTNGHGTHVASTAGGNVYGIARGAEIESVKVCALSGGCPGEMQLASIEYVAEKAEEAEEAGENEKVVANMSIGSPFREWINDAIEAFVNAGGLMVVAAGNSNHDACQNSPSSAEFAWTVMSTTEEDARSSFSSFGACCEVFAPGSSITAAAVTSDSAVRTISGTSMASPHAAGVVAKFWSANRGTSPVDVMRKLEALATDDVIANPGAGSPNRNLFHDCDSQ